MVNYQNVKLKSIQEPDFFKTKVWHAFEMKLKEMSWGKKPAKDMY